MGPPKWLGGDVVEGFAVGAHVNVRVSMLDASSDCWFCDDSEDPNPPLPVGGYVVQVRRWQRRVACLCTRVVQTFFSTALSYIVAGFCLQRVLPGP